MRDYAIDLKFGARDSVSGNSGLVDSVLALVNDSDLSDNQARENAKGFLEGVTFDFHSKDPEVPRELPALYEGTEGRYDCSIYSPRDGAIEKVSLKPESKIVYNGRKDGWETFSLGNTNYSVMID